MPGTALTRIELLPTGPGGRGDLMGATVSLLGVTGAIGAPFTQVAPGVFSGTVDIVRRAGNVLAARGDSFAG